MNEEVEQEIPQTTIDGPSDSGEASTPVTGDETLPLEVMVTSPIEFRETTVIRSGKGDIHVIHEITLGDVVLATLFTAMLMFLVLDRVIRR